MATCEKLVAADIGKGLVPCGAPATTRVSHASGHGRHRREMQFVVCAKHAGDYRGNWTLAPLAEVTPTPPEAA